MNKVFLAKIREYNEKFNYLLPVAVFAAVGGFLLVKSWRKWPDFFVDYGRELYIPWQINSGSVLYKDIAFHNGPLSNYFNALLFKIFGTGFMTVSLFNIFLICVLVFLIYRIFQKTTDAVTATAAGVVFLGLFCFSQITVIGNYNFVSPYSHEMTHGIILSFLSICFVINYISNYRAIWIILTGLAAGLIFLTKIEVFLGLFAGLVLFFALMLILRKLPFTKLLLHFVLFAIFFALPVLSFLLYFSGSMPLSKAFSSMTFSFKMAQPLSQNIFFKTGLGFDNPLGNLWFLCKASAVYLFAVITIGVFCYLYHALPENYRKSGGVLFLAAFALTADYFLSTPGFIDYIGRPFPVALLALTISLFISLVKNRNPETFQRNLPLLILSTFASVMLLKMLLNSRIWHYGFALGMPAGLLVTVIFVYYLPAFYEEEFHAKNFSRLCGCILIALILYHVYKDVSSPALKNKTYAVAEKYDSFFVEPPQSFPSGIRNHYLIETIKEINNTMKPHETFVVFPQGVMLNYLTRRKNPIPNYSFVPADFLWWTEDEIIAAMQASTPDYIVMVTDDNSEYGARFFGQDYAHKLFGWLTANYTPQKFMGDHHYKVIIAAKNQ